MAPSIFPNRRTVVFRSSALAASTFFAAAEPALAQSAKNSQTKPFVIAQIVDTSQGQQDVSKDFLVGARAAWQDINLKGGVRGQKITHLTVETDGSAGSISQAVRSIENNMQCVALSGSVGDRVAVQLMEASTRSMLTLAHAAPWLQSSGRAIDDKTFPIFAPRQAQIEHALKTLSVMGLKELGVVYGTFQDHAARHQELQTIAAGLQLKLQPFQGTNLRLLGQKLTSATPGVLLFLGGTPELADFTLGLETQARQRYVVALADVNLQVLQDMGAARGTPVIATQPVPLVTSALPIVRTYRETMARLFDEPPTALSLAGFIAARYTYEVLNSIEAPLSRQNALVAFQKRSRMDLGGFRVSFDAERCSCNYVTQSMLGRDGRQVG